MKKRILIGLLAMIAAGALMAAPFKVGLVTDLGGIDDKSFNQGTWEGIVRFGVDNKLTKGTDYKFLQSTQDADYIPNLSTFADEKLDLIIAPGFLFTEAMSTVAQQYPNQKFMIIDSVVMDKTGKFLPNVVNAVFAANEGSFLVGAAAGLKAKKDKKNKVGFVGGMNVPLIQEFQAGYEAGVKAAYPECQVSVDYTGSFTDAGIGQAMAAKQFGDGVYIIYQAAGASGNGVIKEAKDRSAKGDIRWAIGVDKDQYKDGIYSGSKSAILTSMMKRVDVASYEVSKMTMTGKFPGGQILTFDLKSKGVGIPDTNPNLSSDISSAVKGYAAKIASGSIKVPKEPAKR